jgi:hypothetical protein
MRIRHAPCTYMPVVFYAGLARGLPDVQRRAAPGQYTPARVPHVAAAVAPGDISPRHLHANPLPMSRGVGSICVIWHRNQ